MLYFAMFTLGYILGTMLCLTLIERRRPTT
jgi:hypothetical protein